MTEQQQYPTREQIALVISNHNHGSEVPWPSDLIIADAVLALFPHPEPSAERLAEVLFDAEYGNGAWHDHTGDVLNEFHERARYVIDRLAELAEADEPDRAPLA